MADSMSRAPWDSWRRGRGGSRMPSARSSAVFDDHLHPGTYPTSQPHTLRPMESRFSLNEQFAATRRDFEFGYDDAASSIWEKSTTADVDGEHDDTLVVDRGSPSTGEIMRRNYYEILCLLESTALKPDEIRKAYSRLVQILLPERQPQHLVPLAQQLLRDVQAAFETLIEPHKRVRYDLSAEQRLDEGLAGSEDGLELREEVSVEESLREAYLNLVQDELFSSTDLEMRLDARRGSDRRKRQFLEPLDLHLQQSLTLALPTFHLATYKKSAQEDAKGRDDGTEAKASSTGSDVPAIYAVPSATVTGGMHGFIDDPSRYPSLLQSRYQPPGPSIHGQRHLEQLIGSRFLPVFSVNLRQELYQTKPQRLTDRPATVLEQELTILPEPSTTCRIGHTFELPPDNRPLNIEVCIQKHASETRPIVGLALHRHVADGTAFLRIDAGDFTLRPAEECRQLSRFSQAAGRFVQARNPFRHAPTIEFGYTVSSYELGLQHGRSLTKAAGKRITTMDSDMDLDPQGSWTVSVGATSDTIASYLRYGRDIFTSLSPSQNATLPPGNRSHAHAGLRAEIELSSTTTSWLQPSHFLALRTLRRIGRFSKLGFEVGLSPANLHLSLYFSRLGRRISIPLLLLSDSSPSRSSTLLFWATLIPFLGLAASTLLPRHLPRRTQPKDSPRDDTDISSAIAAHRREADALTVLLAPGVELRQRLERQTNGLVILSAKYSGAPDAPGDEVADVTVAVAALVDGGSVRIPGGLRKGRLLGFWDPSPGENKEDGVLTVRYLYRGREKSERWVGQEEVRIPGGEEIKDEAGRL